MLGLDLQITGLTLVALATIWTVALINCASVSSGGRTALVVTIAKVALVLGIAIGAFVFAPGNWSIWRVRVCGGLAKGSPPVRAAASRASAPP